MNDTADVQHIKTSARTLMTYRRQRAQSRLRIRALLDTMAAEARRYLGDEFTENDPLTTFAIALVVRSDERLPDDYETQTPRPPTDTVNRLIVEVLGRAITVEIADTGAMHVFGDARNVPFANVTDVRVAGDATYLVIGDEDPKKRSEVPFVRVLADLIDTAVQDEVEVEVPAPVQAAQPKESEPAAAS